MSTFRNSPRAEADLDEITDYFAAHNPDAIRARCRQLANQPRQGRRRDDLAPNVRSVVVRGYVIFYRPSNSGVEILRVLHGARHPAGTVRRRGTAMTVYLLRHVHDLDDGSDAKLIGVYSSQQNAETARDRTKTLPASATPPTAPTFPSTNLTGITGQKGT